MNMEFSVIVPALNEEKRIEKCLKSIKAQDFAGKYEVIVCDGNSEDRTREIAKKYAVVVKEKNRTIAWERNTGAKNAKGKFLAFIDSDSIADKNWLKELETAYKKGAKAVYGNVYSSDFDKSLSKIAMPLFLNFFHLIRMDSPIGSNVSIERKTFEQLKGFDTRLITAEDIDLFRRIRKKGKVVYWPKAFVYASARRTKKWGFAKFFFFHLKNIFKYYFTGKSASKYENVR